MNAKEIIEIIKEGYDKHGYDRVRCSENYVTSLIKETEDENITFEPFLKHVFDKTDSNLVCRIKYKRDIIEVHFDSKPKEDVMYFEYTDKSRERRGKIESILQNRRGS